MRISDLSSDVCSSDLKKCFDQSLESFHKLGTLDIAPPDSHKRIAETGQVPHSALSAHILDIIDGHSSPVPVHFLQVVRRSEEHTSELQSLMRISYAVFCLKKKNYAQYLIVILQTSNPQQHPRIPSYH